MTTKYVEMRNITKKFRDFKLDNVSLEVPQGKIVGFIGENGAGKSTTINLLLNLIDKDSGEIEILGLHYPKDETKIKQQIGVAFDECFYPEELTPHDMGVILSGAYKEWDNEQYLLLEKGCEYSIWYWKRLRLCIMNKNFEMSESCNISAAFFMPLRTFL